MQAAILIRHGLHRAAGDGAAQGNGLELRHRRRNQAAGERLLDEVGEGDAGLGRAGHASSVDLQYAIEVGDVEGMRVRKTMAVPGDFMGNGLFLEAQDGGGGGEPSWTRLFVLSSPRESFEPHYTRKNQVGLGRGRRREDGVDARRRLEGGLRLRGRSGQAFQEALPGRGVAHARRRARYTDRPGKIGAGQAKRFCHAGQADFVLLAVEPVAGLPRLVRLLVSRARGR